MFGGQDIWPSPFFIFICLIVYAHNFLLVFQVIISVSQLIGDVVGICNSYFQESLVMVNNYAKSDKAMQVSSYSYFFYLLFSSTLKDFLYLFILFFHLILIHIQNEHFITLYAVSNSNKFKIWKNSLKNLCNKNLEHFLCSEI